MIPGNLLSRLAGSFLGLLAAVPPAAGAQGGTIALRNYDRFGRPNVDPRPVFLEDGTTRAAGTNFVVELRALDPSNGAFVLLASTNLLDGDRAGLFNAGVANVPTVIPGATAIIEVRIWDRASGADFPSATRRVATAFDNRTGGDGAPPTLPAQLQFQPVCLGPGGCFPHPVRYSLGKVSTLGLVSPDNEFYVGDTQRALPIVVKRSGELLRPTTIRIVSGDDTAVAGRDFVGLDALVEFPAYSTEQGVELGLIGSRTGPGPVRLGLSARDPSDATTVLADGRAWIFGDGDIRVADVYYHDLDGRKKAEGLTIWAWWTGVRAIAVESTPSLENPSWSTDFQYGAGPVDSPTRFFQPDTQRGSPQRFLRVVLR